MTESTDPKVRTWRHSRKGTISGVVLREDDEWITVILDESVEGVATDWEDGEQLTFRKSLAVEVEADALDAAIDRAETEIEYFDAWLGTDGITWNEGKA